MITNDEDEDKMVNLLPLPGSAAGTNCSHPGKNQLQRKQFHIFLTILIIMTMIVVMLVMTCICQAQELSNILLLLSSPPSCLVAIKIMMVTIVTIHDE